MEHANGLNNCDYLVLGFILASGLLALMRGLIREIFSLVAWGGAYFAAAKFYHLAMPALHHYIKNETALIWTARASVFVLVLVILMVIGAVLAGQIRTGALTIIDRSLGFAYGLLRGFAIICIFYLAGVMILWPDIDKPATEQTQDKDRNTPPEWLMKARTRPAVAYGAGFLKQFVPQDMVDKTLENYSKQKDAAQKEIDRQTLEDLSTPKPPAPSGDKAGEGHITVPVTPLAPKPVEAKP
ncbi:MAG: CvpA family protein [Alphaproteobacteria bacterium]|nr:CvpA family protein [Alphaproteobacteria bacterium]